MLKKLPSLTRIKCYEDFYCKLFKVKTLEGVNVSKVHLTEKNQDTLKVHIKREMRKKHKYLSKKYWDYSFAMYWLYASPSTVLNKNAKNGYAWVE